MTTETYHPEYTENAEFWQQADDIANNRIKSKKQVYLPIATLLPDSSENTGLINFNIKEYNEIIWPMATFYDFVSLSVDAAVGAIMRKPVTYQFSKDNKPSILDYLNKNADGRGSNLNQLARKMCTAIERKGRAGILVDAPALTNIAELRSGEVAPRLAFYDASQIIDWEIKYINGSQVLTFLSLRENSTRRKGGVRQNCKRLINYSIDQDGYVYYEIMEDEEITVTEYQLKDNERVKAIPFHICGSISNDWGVDPSPTRTLVELNLLHYRMMSRDYHARYKLGQIQWHVDLGSSESRDPVEDMKELNPDGFIAGSGVTAVTANGGTVSILQAAESNLLSKTPSEIEDKAVKAGATLLEAGSSTETATAANIRSSASTASLSSISANVGMCMYSAIVDLAGYVNSALTPVNIDEIKFSLNMDFFTTQLSPQDKLAYMQMVQQGVLPQSAMYEILKKNGDLGPDVTYDDYVNGINETVGMGGMPVVTGG